MKKVIVKDFALVLLVIFRYSIVNTKDVIAEGWCHEELLHHAVHITDATKVSETNVLLKCRALAGWLIVPLIGLLNHVKQWAKLLLDETIHKDRALLDQQQQ